MAKLTLHVPDDLVRAAKEEAAARDTSVSRLVSAFFRSLQTPKINPDSPQHSLAPRTKRLAGILPDAEMDDYIDALEKKHS